MPKNGGKGIIYEFERVHLPHFGDIDMKVIWKQKIRIDRQEIFVPKGAQFLTVQLQFNIPVIWFLCDSEAEPERRIINVYGTGNSLPEYPGIYIATFQLQVPSGLYVWHVFELDKSL